MSLLIKRFSNNKSKVVGYAKVSNDSLTLINKPYKLITLLNGHEVLSISKKDIKDKKAGHLIGEIINCLSAKSKNNESSRVYKSYWASDEGKKLFEDFKPRLSSRVKLASKVKEKMDMFPSPKISNKINKDILSKNMCILSNKINNLSLILKNAVRNASVVTGRKLVGSMWGADKTQKYLDKKHNDILAFTDKIEKMEFHRENIERTSRRLSDRLKLSDSSEKESKTLREVIIPNVIDSYENVKSCLGENLLNITPILDIDTVFKDNTEYPAKFFISEEVINNLEEDYGHLISFVVEIPVIEIMTILPLEIISSKLNK